MHGITDVNLTAVRTYFNARKEKMRKSYHLFVNARTNILPRRNRSAPFFSLVNFDTERFEIEQTLKKKQKLESLREALLVSLRLSRKDIEFDIFLCPLKKAAYNDESLP